MDYLTQYYKELSETLTVQKQALEAQIQEANNWRTDLTDADSAAIEMRMLRKALEDPSHKIHKHPEEKAVIMKTLKELEYAQNTKSTKGPGQSREAQIQEANIRSASEISTSAIETARKSPDPGGTFVQLSKKAADRVDDGQRLLKALADPSHEIHQNSEAKAGIVKVLGDLLHSPNTRETSISGQPAHRGGAGAKDMKSAIRVLRNRPLG